MTSTELVDCMSLEGGSRIDVETKSRRYLIECLGGNAFRISGHPVYCPEPVPASLSKPVITRGSHLHFLLNERLPITTTRVVRLRVERARPPAVTSSIH